jgi:hypothetical protein
MRHVNQCYTYTQINVLMAACAWSLRKWLIATAIFLFWSTNFTGIFSITLPNISLVVLSEP